MEEKEQKTAVSQSETEPRKAEHADRRPRYNKGNRKPRQPRQEEKQFEEKVVKISRITKVVKGGKRMRFSALVVIGDGKGRFGYGLGKSQEVPEAIKKAVAAARRNLCKLSITKENSITHTVIGEFGSTRVFLKPAPEGTGLIAGGAVRSILELAGVKNVYSKIYGSRTQVNAVKATVEGLKHLKTYNDVLTKRYNKTSVSEETK